MSEAELESMRLNMRVQILEQLICSIFVVLAPTWPGGKSGLSEALEQMRRQHAKIVLPGADPATSDLYAAEFQETLGKVLSGIEAVLRT